MHFSTSLIPFLLAVTAVVDARMQRKRCEDYPTSPNVPGKAIDFSTHNSSTHTPEEFLNQMRFKVSNFTVGAAAGSVPRIFEKKLCDCWSGVKRDEVRSHLERSNRTTRTLMGPSRRSRKRRPYLEFVSASLRALAVTVRHLLIADLHRGIFFYESDTAEVDIELLSSYYETGYEVCSELSLFFR